MSEQPTTFNQVINESSTAVYKTILKDENGVVIASGAIDSLTLTLSDPSDGSIINSRNAVDALNANNVTIDGVGQLVFSLQPADTAIRDGTKLREVHRATFQMQFNTSGFSTWDVDFHVRNLSKVTS